MNDFYEIVEEDEDSLTIKPKCKVKAWRLIDEINRIIELIFQEFPTARIYWKGNIPHSVEIIMMMK